MNSGVFRVLPVFRYGLYPVVTLSVIVAVFSVPVLSWHCLPANAQEIERPSPKTLPAPLKKSDILLQAGQAEAAKSIVEEYARQHPGSPDALVRKARMEYRLGQWEKSQTTLERGLQSSPKNLLLLSELANVYYQQSVTQVHPKNHLSQASNLASDALRIQPTHVPAMVVEGNVQLANQNMVDAERSFREALSIDPNSIPALYGMTNLYIQTREYGQARKTLGQVLELSPNDPDGQFLSAKLLSVADHPQEAIDYALKSEALDIGRNIDRDFLVATQYEKLGEPQKAIDYHQRVLKVHPQFVLSWQRLGPLYAQVNQPAESQRAYREAIALDPRWFDNELAQVSYSIRSGNSTGALAQLNRLLAIEPDAKRNWEPIIENLKYDMALNQSEQANGSPSKLIPLAVLADVNALASEQLKPSLGKQGYIAGFAMPDQDFALNTLKNKLLQQADGAPVSMLEAPFLSGHFDLALAQMEMIDGLPANQYAIAGDRLMLLRHYQAARIFYQRALELYRAEGGADQATQQSVTAAIQRVDNQQQQSKRTVGDADQHYYAKRYAQAVQLYLQALHVDPMYETAYLRLGDTLEKIKLKKDDPIELSKDQRQSLTYWSYRQASRLNPSLLDSKGFQKSLDKAFKD